MAAPTITAQTVASTTSATLTVSTVGTTPGTYTVTDPVTGATATLTVAQGAMIFPRVLDGLGGGNRFGMN